MIILRYVVQKLCVANNCTPPGLSIANLRYPYFVFSFILLKYGMCSFTSLTSNNVCLKFQFVVCFILLHVFYFMLVSNFDYYV